MTNVFCPMIELGAIIPGVVLAYLPIKKHLKVSKLRLFPVMILSLACLCTLCGFVCYRYNLKSFVLAIPIVFALSAAYCCSLKTSVWKSASVLLAVCGVFACIASITRAFDSITFPQNTTPWFEIKSAVLFNILCWMFVILAWYPATHGASELLDDENIAQTWYVFWILPIIFILLNFFIIPWNPNILHTGRIMQGYIVISVSLLVLLLIFYALLYFIAKSLNRNNKLAQKNQFLNMQRAQYDALKVAIEETRQARHDMRHHFAVLNALAEQKNWEELEKYLSSASQNIPDTELVLCKNNAVNAIIGHYYSKCKSNGIPFKLKIDIPENFTVSESDICLVIANLLENAFEASMKLDRDKRQIKMYARPHSEKILLISVENAFNGEITEKDGFFGSSKRNGNGIGTQSVRRIAEKDGGYCRFSHENGIFTADVMLHGKN